MLEDMNGPTDDVTPEARAIQDAILRKMTPAQKLQMAYRMTEDAKKMKAAWIAAQHPDWSQAQVEAELRRILFCART